MKLKMSVTRNGAPVCEGVYAVSDAESFGAACSDVWEKLTARKIARARNVGALFEALEEGMVADLTGISIQLKPQDP
jgi:hypothetical protein